MSQPLPYGWDSASVGKRFMHVLAKQTDLPPMMKVVTPVSVVGASQPLLCILIGYSRHMKHTIEDHLFEGFVRTLRITINAQPLVSCFSIQSVRTKMLPDGKRLEMTVVAELA